MRLHIKRYDHLDPGALYRNKTIQPQARRREELDNFPVVEDRFSERRGSKLMVVEIGRYTRPRQACRRPQIALFWFASGLVLHHSGFKVYMLTGGCATPRPQMAPVGVHRRAFELQCMSGLNCVHGRCVVRTVLVVLVSEIRDEQKAIGEGEGGRHVPQ